MYKQENQLEAQHAYRPPEIEHLGFNLKQI